MADRALRSLARAAAAGDVEAQARELLERVRAGTLTRDRLELAAYAGHEGARAVLGDPLLAGFLCSWEGSDGKLIDPWVRGLHTWRAGPAHAPLRAALAATRAALPSSPCCPNHDDIAGDDFLRGCPSWLLTERAIDDAADFLAGRGLGSRLPASSHNLTMHVAGYHLAEALWDVQCGHDRGSPNQTTCAAFEAERCAELAGEALVRDAIRAELIAWALGPAPAPATPHVDRDPELPPTPAAELAPNISTPLSQPTEDA